MTDSALKSVILVHGFPPRHLAGAEIYAYRMAKWLVEQGHTVVVIEHNLDMIKCADFIIDLGPEGGERGGEVVVAGTPEECILSPHSHTGRYLKKLVS